MIVHVLTEIIGIFSCLICAWLLNSILESKAREVKPDGFVIFWCIYSFVVGAFLITTG